MAELLFTLLSFIIGISALIAFHEYGHFWVARRFGVHVECFSIGLGKKLYRWYDKSGTEYALSAIPLGGYVKMLDSREKDVPETLAHQDFFQKPVYQKFLIVLAGPIFNFIFAIAAYWLVFMIGIKTVIPIVGDVYPDSFAQKAGLKSGQEIVEIQNKPVASWQDVSTAFIGVLGANKDIRVKVLDDEGSSRTLSFDLSSWRLSDSKQDLFESLGFEVGRPKVPAVVGLLQANEPAMAAGFQVGDELLALNGQAIDDWSGFVETVQGFPEREINILIKRAGQTQTITATPRAKPNGEGVMEGYLGVGLELSNLPNSHLRTVRMGPVDAFGEALTKTGEYSLMTLSVLKKMVVGLVSVQHLSGPISIAQGAGQTANIGFVYYLSFLAIISISLGVLNLLPIPILDGGHLVYYFFEFIFRRPVPMSIQHASHVVGMLALFTLMTLALYNDIVRLQ